MHLPIVKSIFRKKVPQKLLDPVSKKNHSGHGVGLVTMVKNEDTFLIHWLTHYQRIIDQPRFYILDDASDKVDTREIVRQVGAEENCDVIRLPVGPFSDTYKSKAISSLANILIHRHTIVLASDVDEIITPIGEARSQDFEELLRTAPEPFASPIGVLPVHDISEEPDFDPFLPLAEQRSWGFLHGGSTKPLIWKGQEAQFTPGQHTLRGHQVPVITNLATMHLRWVDRKTALRRQEIRNETDFGEEQLENHGTHWRAKPEKLLQNNLMNPRKHMEGARSITEVSPEFIHTHMVKHKEHYILKERKILQAVSLKHCI